MDKILTVIIPSYNMEAYLPKCLGSLVVSPELMDTLEVLVVNDGSKDRTSEIAHEFEAKYPQTFKVIDKANGNYGSCVNAALKVAAGKFIKVLDADDSFNTKEFVTLMEVLQVASDDIDLILTDVCQVDEFDNEVLYSRWKLPTERCVALEAFLEYGLVFSMHAFTYRTSILREMKYEQSEGISYTDGEWISLPLSKVRKIYYKPVTVYRYLVGRSGQTVGQYAKNIQMLVHLFDTVVCFFNQSRDTSSETVKKILGQFIAYIGRKISDIYLLDSDVKVANKLLRDFDQHFKVVASTLYDSIPRKVVFTRVFGGFDYLRFWRAHPWLRGVFVRLLRLYVCRSKN